jgi:cutinase
MKSFVLLATVAAFGVEAQRGKAKDPYQYKAGDALSSDYNPMVPFEKTPPWPKNFGTGKIPLGPKPSGCYPFELIIARGTSEPGAFGAVVGDPVLARVQQIMGKDKVRGYSVQWDGNLMGATAVTGASDLANRVSKKSKECPNMQFAVMGYSVGGGIAASGLKQIPQGVRSRVKAVVLYAPFGGASAPSDFRGRTLKNCAKGDSVCLNGSNLAAHISYNTKGTKWHTASVKFIVAAFQGHPLAGNPETAWTQPWLKSIAGI